MASKCYFYYSIDSRKFASKLVRSHRNYQSECNIIEASIANLGDGHRMSIVIGGRCFVVIAVRVGVFRRLAIGPRLPFGPVSPRVLLLGLTDAAVVRLLILCTQQVNVPQSAFSTILYLLHAVHSLGNDPSNFT